MKHEITMNEIKALEAKGVYTWMKKDNSPRGARTVMTDELNIGDEVVINNYFTTIIA